MGVGFLRRFGVSAHSAGLLVRTAPVLGVVATILLVLGFDLESRAVSVVGAIPAGIPALGLPAFSLQLAQELLVPAALISIIRSEEHTSELQSHHDLVCRLLLEKKKIKKKKKKRKKKKKKKIKNKAVITAA